MTQPTSWAELQHQLLANGNRPVPVTPQNVEAARALKAKGLAVIKHATIGPIDKRTTIRLKEQSK